MVYAGLRRLRTGQLADVSLCLCFCAKATYSPWRYVKKLNFLYTDCSSTWSLRDLGYMCLCHPVWQMAAFYLRKVTCSPASDSIEFVVRALACANSKLILSDEMQWCTGISTCKPEVNILGAYLIYIATGNHIIHGVMVHLHWPVPNPILVCLLAWLSANKNMLCFSIMQTWYFYATAPLAS